MLGLYRAVHTNLYLSVYDRTVFHSLQDLFYYSLHFHYLPKPRYRTCAMHRKLPFPIQIAILTVTILSCIPLLARPMSCIRYQSVSEISNGITMGGTGNKISSTKLHIPPQTNRRRTRESLDRLYKLQNPKHSIFLIVALDDNVCITLRIQKMTGSIVALFVERRGPLCEKAHSVCSP